MQSRRPALESPSSSNPNSKNVLWGSRSVDIFDKIEQIGEGTYGKVYLAKSKETGESVALKKIRMDNEKEGFPITAIREIKILKELHHPNVVQLKEIVTSKATKENKGKSSIYMVFEYMDHDLTGLMMSDNNLWNPSEAHIKCYMKQLLQGLHHCHSHGVLHRDIKGSNLLLDNRGHLKLADFGLARTFFEHVNKYTNRVITLWYRPPELLLGAEQYDTAIDMWSVGCILAELLAKRAIFPGKNEVDQLELIYKICGTPTEEIWPDIVSLPLYKAFKPQKLYRRVLKENFKSFPSEALDLIDKLLTLDPKKRISASEALDSEYFWTEPMPCDPKEIPPYPTSHEFQAKKRRVQQQANDALKRQRTSQGSNQSLPLPSSSSSYNSNSYPSNFYHHPGSSQAPSGSNSHMNQSSRYPNQNPNYNNQNRGPNNNYSRPSSQSYQSSGSRNSSGMQPNASQRGSSSQPYGRSYPSGQQTSNGYGSSSHSHNQSSSNPPSSHHPSSSHSSSSIGNGSKQPPPPPH